MPKPSFFQSISEKYVQKVTDLHKEKLLPFLNGLKQKTFTDAEESKRMLFSFYRGGFDLIRIMFHDYLQSDVKKRALIEAYFYKMEGYLFNSLHHISTQHQSVYPLRPSVRECVEHLCAQSRTARKRFEQDKEQQELDHIASWMNDVGAHIESAGCCPGIGFLPDSFPELTDDDDFSEGAAYCQ
ncbi:hypothetical protein [Legionella sp. CNM-4043-24]|uniref:hypothetical protein n=1 Tax=Legionella sp. CNM-4043-24 TaxID=3421646 RepID=UPI00403AECE0